jgi:hypothetical protein
VIFRTKIEPGLIFRTGTRNQTKKKLFLKNWTTNQKQNFKEINKLEPGLKPKPL